MKRFVLGQKHKDCEEDLVKVEAETHHLDDGGTHLLKKTSSLHGRVQTRRTSLLRSTFPLIDVRLNKDLNTET